MAIQMQHVLFVLSVHLSLDFATMFLEYHLFQFNLQFLPNSLHKWPFRFCWKQWTKSHHVMPVTTRLIEREIHLHIILIIWHCCTSAFTQAYSCKIFYSLLSHHPISFYPKFYFVYVSLFFKQGMKQQYAIHE